jgi:predicted HicB family RNase H-like nuclease
MDYRDYTASMVFDSDDKIIVGRVMDIEDIITFDGNSVGECEASFHEVIDD